MDPNRIDLKELQKRQEAVAISDPEHLIRWLVSTGRDYLVFVTKDLCEALEPITDDGHPVGLQMLQNLINCYRQHRLAQPSGEMCTENLRAPDGSKSIVTLPIMKDDRLTVPELDRAIRSLMREMHDRNPAWSIEHDPL